MDTEIQTSSIFKWVGLGVTLLIIVILFFSSYAVINPGERGMKVRLGHIVGSSLNEGLAFKVPFIDTIYKFDVKTQKLTAKETAASNDLQTVQLESSINYHINPTFVGKLYQDVGLGYRTVIIEPAMHEALKASTAKFTAEQLITQREKVKETAFSLLKERLNINNIILDNLSITDLDFSQSFNQAIELKVTAEQQALAAKNKLSQIEFEAQQKVSTAKADAESIRLQGEALKQSPELVKLKAVEKWDGVLPVSMFGSSPLPFIDVK